MSYYRTILYYIVQTIGIQSSDLETSTRAYRISIYSYSRLLLDALSYYFYNELYLLITRVLQNSKEETSSQFFITTNSTLYIDKKFIPFSKVIQSQEVVQQLQKQPIFGNNDYKPIGNLLYISVYSQLGSEDTLPIPLSTRYNTYSILLPGYSLGSTSRLRREENKYYSTLEFLYSLLKPTLDSTA